MLPVARLPAKLQFVTVPDSAKLTAPALPPAVLLVKLQFSTVPELLKKIAPPLPALILAFLIVRSLIVTLETVT